MSTTQQLSIKTINYTEAIRYMNNAVETLKKAGKQGNHYKDEKYGKTACGIAYVGVLKALDGYLLLRGVPNPKKRKTIEHYNVNIAKLDRKIMQDLDHVYRIIHLYGYYDGLTKVPIIKDGFDTAYKIIKRIEP